MLDQLGGAQPFNEPKLQPCAVNALIDEAAEIERPSAENKQIELRVDTLPSAWVDVDSTQIVRVLLNLLRNAIEATPAGGVVRVSAQAEKGGVTVAVADSGRGMTKEQVSQAFQPGFSTKGKGEGGIGLAVSYLIADAHGGGLDIQSEPGQGPTVRLTLSRAGSAGQAPSGGSGTATMNRMPAQRVVVAMAPSAHRDAVVDALLRHGCGEIAEVETTEEVGAILSEDPEWDVMIRDGSISEIPQSTIPVIDIRDCGDGSDGNAVVQRVVRTLAPTAA
jgi:anti-sigma regulatory factor (Ser/Thr protein kinase)